jgi:hypothetical protein
MRRNRKRLKEDKVQDQDENKDAKTKMRGLDMVLSRMKLHLSSVDTHLEQLCFMIIYCRYFLCRCTKTKLKTTTETHVKTIVQIRMRLRSLIGDHASLA